ncbi:hypothetical protein D7V93_03580 [Corallococcus llansteffanensis]|uniref:TonB-dependent receptor n=1 Tax=Corallococcus llansteffanensis TaxID=2316731 RepID=A0A3A8QEE4_9BACT|nr:hypothetical protein D7V93_03580 [Corallococcus llansteffanensis]
MSFLGADSSADTEPSLTTFQAALEARSPELASGLSAEAALSLFLTTGGIGHGVGIVDNSSAFRLRYHPSGWDAREGWALSVFPLSTTRLYMGFSYPVTWEREAFPRRSSTESALELSLSRRRWDAFVAIKSAAVLNELALEDARHYALLLGGALDVTPEVRLALKGTWLNRGQAPGAAVQGTELKIKVKGASAQASWHRGAPIGSSVDLSLYSGDPTFFERFFLPETWPGDFAASVSLEGNLVSQQLQNPDVAPPQPRDELSHSAALEARLKQGFWRLHALAYLRTPAFIQVDAPGLPPYQAFSDDTETHTEVSGTLGGDYHIAAWGLTPGLLARVTLPATLQYDQQGPLVGSERLVVLRGPNKLSILPAGVERRPVLTVKATARWDLGTVAGVLAEVSYERDPNRSTFEDDGTGVAQPVLLPPSTVGFNLLLQARL